MINIGNEKTVAKCTDLGLSVLERLTGTEKWLKHHWGTG